MLPTQLTKLRTILAVSQARVRRPSPTIRPSLDPLGFNRIPTFSRSSTTPFKTICVSSPLMRIMPIVVLHQTNTPPVSHRLFSNPPLSMSSLLSLPFPSSVPLSPSHPLMFPFHTIPSGLHLSLSCLFALCTDASPLRTTSSCSIIPHPFHAIPPRPQLFPSYLCIVRTITRCDFSFSP